MLPQNLNLKTNLKYSQKAHLKRCISLEHTGLSFQEYELLVQDNLLPPAGNYSVDQRLLLSEVIWLKMMRELEACNFSREVIRKFARILMMEVAMKRPEKGQDFILTPDDAFSSWETSNGSTMNFLLLDIQIIALLLDKKDTLFQFTREGQLCYNHHLPHLESTPLKGPAVTISLHQLLASLAGQANVPALDSVITQLSTVEAQVINALREPTTPELIIKKAPAGEKSYSLELSIKRMGMGTLAQVERLFKKLTCGYGELLAKTNFKKHIYYEYLEKHRL